MPVRPRRTVAVLGATMTAAATAAAALAVGPAEAAPAPPPPPPLQVTYDAAGSAMIAKTGSSVQLGPTTLSVALQAATGDFTGSLPLPQTSTSFKASGFLPISAKVDFLPAGPVTGKLGTRGRGRKKTVAVTSTALYTIKLTDVKIGILPALVGNQCQTKAPVAVPANTPEGEAFSLATGGRLTGTFTIGEFANCGLTTLIVNSLVPGDGNTIDITLSNGRIG